MPLKPSEPIRRVAFEYPEDMSPVWTPAAPEFSCAANSVSLMMPTVEPYFVRSIRKALPDLGGRLKEETELYLFQEAQHHGQHLRFNRILLTHYPALVPLNRLIGSTYRRIEQRRSRQFNIGLAAGSETMAYSAARWAAGNRRELFRGADEVPATLFLWHLAEEVEHKSVAHDVYHHLYGNGLRSRLIRALATGLSLLLMIAFVVAGTTIMITGERRLLHPLTWLRLVRWSVTFAFELLSNLAMTLFPGFHPDDMADPRWYEVWLQEFDAETGTLPLWHRADPDTHRRTERPGRDHRRQSDGPIPNRPIPIRPAPLATGPQPRSGRA